jgi:5-methylcytosine-specific restriction endonuclease McrA
MSVRRHGQPWIENEGVVVYEVHDPGRKTFGLSFSGDEFSSWATDGRTVQGYAEFPGGKLLFFKRTITSGNELTLSAVPGMIDEYRKCTKGDKIRFHFSDLELQGKDLTDPRPNSSEPRPEGGQYIRIHKDYERDAALSAQVRENAKGVCTVCKVDFEKIHGDIGSSVIEAHHLTPISKGQRDTSEDDLIAICANCHRLTHALMRSDPEVGFPSLEALQDRFGLAHSV